MIGRTLGHYWCRLQKEHDWINFLWRLNPRGRVRRLYHSCSAPARLAAQWATLRRLWPQARLVIQIGAFYESFRADAAWMRTQLGLKGGRNRRGLGKSAGFRCRDRLRLGSLLRTAHPPVLVWRQSGRVSGAVRERVLALAVLPGGWEVLQLRAGWLLGGSGGDIR